MLVPPTLLAQLDFKLADTSLVTLQNLRLLFQGAQGGILEMHYLGCIPEKHSLYNLHQPRTQTPPKSRRLRR